MAVTLQELQKQDAEARKANRKRAVADFTPKGNQKKAPVVYEVIEGKHHMPATKDGGDVQRGRILWPGERFIPTQQQVEQTIAGKGGLCGKVVEVEGANAATLGRDSRTPLIQGADIGIRALPMAKTTADLAIKLELTEDDFRGVQPGPEGRITRAQVLALAEAKGGSQDN